MKYCLVADDGQARVVVAESDDLPSMHNVSLLFSMETQLVASTAKFHVCRRDPSANGHHLVTIETWEKGVKL